jgi:hypothetical protein
MYLQTIGSSRIHRTTPEGLLIVLSLPLHSHTQLLFRVHNPHFDASEKLDLEALFAVSCIPRYQLPKQIVTTTIKMDHNSQNKLRGNYT